MRLPKRSSIPDAIGKELSLTVGVGQISARPVESLLLKPCWRKVSEIVIGTEPLDDLRH
jgi:hypothetical protein